MKVQLRLLGDMFTDPRLILACLDGTQTFSFLLRPSTSFHIMQLLKVLHRLPVCWSLVLFRYLYGDLYAGAIWAATEDPENSGNFTNSKIPFDCAHDSPIPCDSGPGSLPALGYIFSFGQDNKKDVYILASSGVYRVVPPSRCNYTCSLEKASTASPPSPSPSYASHLSNFNGYLFLQLSSLLLILMSFI
jgi:hypothetical protein